MTRPKKVCQKRGRKPAHPDEGAITGATRSARHRERLAAYEDEIAASWLRLASAATIKEGDLMAQVYSELEALGRSRALEILRSRLSPDDRTRFDAIADISGLGSKDTQIPSRDEMRDEEPA